MVSGPPSPTAPVAVPLTRPATLAHRAEFWALRGALAGLRLTDWRRAGNIGARLAMLGWPLNIRRDIVCRQIAAVFPGLDDAEVQRIAREAYAHLGRLTAESAVVPKLGPDGVLEMFEGAEGWETIEKPLATGRGVIIVTAHIGNWELAGTYVAARGIPLDVVVRRMGNPLFDAYLNDLRLRQGMTVVYDQEAVRRTPRALNVGRAVAFLADQGGKGIAAIDVPFFGRPARTPHGPAIFAMRANVPLVFGTAIRQPSGRYRLTLETVPITRTGDRDADVRTLVREYTRRIERSVRAHPEQYFWHHRRWKWQPADTPAELRDPTA